MAKTKISVTVESTLVEQIDELELDASRSEIVEIALARWLSDRQRRTLETETERYYRGLTREERDEDSGWARASADSIDKTWR